MNIENILYIIIIIAGFSIPFVVSYFLNNKYKVINQEYYIYSYILFIVGFVIFAKLFYIFLNFDFNSVYNFINNNDIFNKLVFILTGYTFIGGYIGGILAIMFFMKIIHNRNDDIIIMYLMNLILMYAILKIGCLIKGCCYGIGNIPIQLIESIANLIVYFLVLTLFIQGKNKKIIIATSLILFGLLRFIISFFRVYTNYFAFIFIQSFCIVLILVGIKYIFNLNNQGNL